MAIVIDALDVVRNKKRLPVEAFFVDTNVVIAFADPFSRSLDPKLAVKNAEITEALHVIKSLGYKSCALTVVVFEYYKHIQVGYYLKHTQADSFDLKEFKKLRESDQTFQQGRGAHLKKMQRLFTRNFPVLSEKIDPEETVRTFEGMKADFGDYVLFKAVIQCDPKMHCIFSNDSDFYSFPDELFLLTTQNKMLQIASREKKLFKG